MKLTIAMLSLIEETLTRLDDAQLHDLGADTNTWVALPELPLIGPDSRTLGHYRWDGNDESWYFEPVIYTLTEKEN